MGYISYFFSKTSSRVYLPIPIKGVDSRKNIFISKHWESKRAGLWACILLFKTVTLHSGASSRAPPSIKDKTWFYKDLYFRFHTLNQEEPLFLWVIVLNPLNQLFCLSEIQYLKDLNFIKSNLFFVLNTSLLPPLQFPPTDPESW